KPCGSSMIQFFLSSRLNAMVWLPSPCSMRTLSISSSLTALFFACSSGKTYSDCDPPRLPKICVSASPTKAAARTANRTYVVLRFILRLPLQRSAMNSHSSFIVHPSPFLLPPAHDPDAQADAEDAHEHQPCRQEQHSADVRGFVHLIRIAFLWLDADVARLLAQPGERAGEQGIIARILLAKLTSRNRFVGRPRRVAKDDHARFALAAEHAAMRIAGGRAAGRFGDGHRHG